MFSVYDAVFKAKAGRCNVQTGYCKCIWKALRSRFTYMIRSDDVRGLSGFRT
ncbi:MULTISPECIES: hypothetical protein [Bacteroides]|uniref:hypothetical protein n=1 Tax=Bacteroides TaxID=816 RepID=UPI00189F60FC|nr:MULTISPECIES: hypothetical protein [Bacteroides]